ncbi:dipeptide ABC transporter ATP-binding protein [Rhodococcoides yunnanense]|uniref:dipeptide ABC transporter ATP-binding protein n=1 Tax=Rhodococcoides yunnanense TaxID=278209 RepID=UPI0009348336|nr:ABC transporter ATP-binding protein [Rhodococcus yunnanensis]
MSEIVLDVDGLTVGYRTRGKVHRTVHEVSFAVPKGGAVALVGESGSGKSTLANVVLRLAAPNAVIEAGEVTYNGESLSTASTARLRALRGNDIAYVPQDPANSLNPVRTIESQLLETLAVTGSAHDGSATVVELLTEVGIPRPAEVATRYPHQLSGGMLQRVLIASAIAARPTLLIADEPTSALDVTVQRRVLDLLDHLRGELGSSLLLITHDLALAKERCDDLVVLEAGRVQETGSAAVVFENPTSDYTRSLLADVPALNADKFGKLTAAPVQQSGSAVRIVDVSKRFARGGVLALDGVNLNVGRGTTHAIVGESGSGKTTLARLILGLDHPTSGEVFIDGAQLDHSKPESLHDARRRLQLVYQNPFVSLDPTYTAAQSVAEPLLRYRIGTRASRAAKARELLTLVGLPAAAHDSLPKRLSGGQRQRVAIARALALEPEVLVLDEPTSALDVTVQAQILELLVALQHELGSTYLLISHDLGVVRQIADDITVLRHGIVVESGSARDVFAAPTQDYTRDLIESVPGWAESGARDTVPA